MGSGRMLRVTAITGFLLAGCSSDLSVNGNASDTAIRQALTEQLVSGAAVNTEEEARCVADATVDAIGEARLAELGVTPDDVSGLGTAAFTDDEVATMVDAFFDCVDIRQVIATNLAGEAGEEAAGCMAENLPEDVLRDIVRAFNFAGQELPAESQTALLDVGAECGVPIG